MEEAHDRGWYELANGELIAAAESAGFDALVTTDKNIRYQQNLSARTIALVVLGNSQWPKVHFVADTIAKLIDEISPGDYIEVPIPLRW